ncbi:MAG: class I SAM-dependent methyltransferase [Candidatus Omnitrophota bacterium]
MADSVMNLFQEACRTARASAPLSEPWPNYYKLRSWEMQTLFEHYGPRPGGLALDAGAGIGFNSYMLGGLYGRVIAADLYEKDLKTHSLGMEKARGFLMNMPGRNIETVSCSCELLPFGDRSFDAVYLLYTLEHITDRTRALKEAGRVLKDDGDAVVVVPCFMERFLYPLVFYRDFVKSVLGRLRKKTGVPAGGANGHKPDNDGRRTGFLKQFHNAYPHFPFPEPHGEYGNYFSELFKSFSFTWLNLVRKSGLRVKKVFTTGLFPKEFSSLVLGEKALDAYVKTLWLNKRFGENGMLRHIGQNLCMVLGRGGEGR